MSDSQSPAAMLEAAFNGELSLDGEETKEPQTANEEEVQTEGVEQPAASEQQPESKPSTDDEPEGAPIASKSGTYTIPYEKLAEARNSAKTLATENEQLKQQLAELTAKQQANLAAAAEQAQARADAGQAQTQADKQLQAAQAAISEGVNVEVFGDFSEEAIAKGIKTLQDQAREQLRAELTRELKGELEKELAPLRQERAKSAEEAHYGAIYAKHPDADEVLESGEFQKWRESLPGFVRMSMDAALKAGTTTDVIEVFDTFKNQTGRATAQPALRPEVQRKPVASLSEIAGAPPVDATQRALMMADNNPNALIDQMLGMTSEQIDNLMNRAV